MLEQSGRVSALLCLSLALASLSYGDCFMHSTAQSASPLSCNIHRAIPPHSRPTRTTTIVKEASQAEQEAAALLAKVRKMRAEIADLEGKSLVDVEKEAEEKKATDRQRLEEMESDRAAREQERAAGVGDKRSGRSRRDDGKFLSVPVNVEDQIEQASRSVEAAFKDGITRQIVRFALLPEDKALNEDVQWPGGAKQMYREAAGPQTRALLSRVRAPTSNATDLRTVYKPNVTAEEIWDFDGSALVRAEAATGAEDDVQCLVFPNTDTKYTNDIRAIGKAMGDRLVILVNPFWRNLDSWGINLLAPKGKSLAKEVIFDGGYKETYVLLKTSARGEDCVALKAYPYDWQLYAFREDDSWPYGTNVLWLGSTKEEPTSANFTELLSAREEFKLNKNMRYLQRMRGGNGDD